MRCIGGTLDGQWVEALGMQLVNYTGLLRDGSFEGEVYDFDYLDDNECVLVFTETFTTPPPFWESN